MGLLLCPTNTPPPPRLRVMTQSVVLPPGICLSYYSQPTANALLATTLALQTSNSFSRNRSTDGCLSSVKHAELWLCYFLWQINNGEGQAVQVTKLLNDYIATLINM